MSASVEVEAADHGLRAYGGVGGPSLSERTYHRLSCRGDKETKRDILLFGQGIAVGTMNWHHFLGNEQTRLAYHSD
eukprot:scaffold478475_cov142-Attheya_sp.AAC.1